MATLVKTKRRINSITSTRKITKAMELVASVKLKRYKNSMSDSFNYVNSIKEVISYLDSQIEKENEFEFEKRNSKRLFIIVNSNLGLCASYNNDIYKFSADIINKDDEIIPIGIKGYTHFKNLGFNVNDNYVSLNERIDYNLIDKFAKFILSEYKNNKYSEINIIFIDYLNSITFKPKLMRLFPNEINSEKKDVLLPPIIEPDAKTLLNCLYPIYVTSLIYQVLITSLVSEQASRRNAMETATDNANDLLTKLKLEYNKARQSAITQEISEVVSGANNVN